MKPGAMTTTKLVAVVVFAGGFGDPAFTKNLERHFNLDPDRAADNLQQAGYEVHQLPRKYSDLTHPLDDFRQ